MPKSEFDPEDPIEFIGVQLRGQSEAALRDMTLCFAEEFVREGWDEEKIFAVFRNPFYQGPYLAWKQKGDEFIRSVIGDAIRMWRPDEGRI
ncbi:MAG: hypothetical protein A3G87_07150 [Omnitrophica bacterium RIFCSPLOWO2_12_FULL_50_11]|nr:MAG: hypothetical protein A3G87_07150 [Omnitrophica bacterium RIFCSPLOWO2_12_FULL_50_11]